MSAPGRGGDDATRLRVLALAPYPETSPSTRYRLVQLAPALAARGVSLTLHPFLSMEEHRTVRAGLLLGSAGRSVVRALARARRVVDGASTWDAVLVQRGIGLVLDRSLLGRLIRSGTPVVYDFDDAVYLPQDQGRWWVEAIRDPDRTTRAFCRAAGVVLAGNAHLAAYAMEAVGPAAAERVRVLPSVVDTERFAPAPHDADLPTLGWVGSDSTVPYLEALAPALRALATRVPHRLVVVAGTRRPRLPGVSYEFVPWSPDADAARFQALDVGLYPLDDTPWTRGKCGFKALQYLACGVPCVASPVGVLRDIVRPGETGLHADGTDAWVDACARLLGDPATRAGMGRAGRALVRARYSVEAGAPILASALEDAASR
jgi:glycosyltransferase involved in cell wall biosynthesis